ncbi:hypothetical protein [Escherichia coli]|uniref:hypothetical protein n=1 Tax=Escherichia coli TaxID=562 RepID=UPI000CFE1E05|nr:hypothetical protein [Escherichia coli]
MKDILLKERAEKTYTVEITHLSPFVHPNVGWPEDLKVGTIVTAYTPKVSYLMEALETDEWTAKAFKHQMDKEGTLIIHKWYNELDKEDPLIITKECYNIIPSDI